MHGLRTALRSGASEAVCLYRRDLANMPGSRKEFLNAIEEGARFEFLTNPIEIAADASVLIDWLGSLAAAFGQDAGAAVSDTVDRFVKQPGLEPGIFGLVLVLFILLEPQGIYGRWVKVKLYFSQFPLYKRASFKRQKAYMRSERLR